ncbi:MAG: type VII toxin-antitoxin system HepT family RNase toxin [Betaproteobacteria bacterium]
MADGIREKLARYFGASAGRYGIEVAYLFGSVAKGKVSPHSDVDVAVLFSAGLTTEERFDLQLALGTELSDQLGREVDVVDLAASPLILQHQVLAYGECVFERDSRVRVRFEVASRRAYFDLKRVRDLHTVGMLKAMEEYLHDLRQVQGMTWEEFAGNKMVRRYVERTLQLAIEGCLDLGSHIISDERMREPGDNKDIFVVLAENGVVPEAKLTELKKMAQFRNLIVHVYARIDPALVYHALHNRLGDLEDFALAIKSRYLDQAEQNASGSPAT